MNIFRIWTGKEIKNKLKIKDKKKAKPQEVPEGSSIFCRGFEAE